MFHSQCFIIYSYSDPRYWNSFAQSIAIFLQLMPPQLKLRQIELYEFNFLGSGRDEFRVGSSKKWWVGPAVVSSEIAPLTLLARNLACALFSSRLRAAITRNGTAVVVDKRDRYYARKDRCIYISLNAVDWISGSHAVVTTTSSTSLSLRLASSLFGDLPYLEARRATGILQRFPPQSRSSSIFPFRSTFACHKACLIIAGNDINAQL